MIIGIESLNRIFEQYKNKNQITYRELCQMCGCDVEVYITKTSEGYGLQDGVLYEQSTQNFSVLCTDCYIRSGGPKSLSSDFFARLKAQMTVPVFDNCGRRIETDRRKYSYWVHIPERRSGKRQRNKKDRRVGMGTEKENKKERRGCFKAGIPRGTIGNIIKFGQK